MRALIITSLLLASMVGTSLSSLAASAKSNYKTDLDSKQIKIEELAASLRKEATSVASACAVFTINMNVELESIRKNVQEQLNEIENQANDAIDQIAKIRDLQTDGLQCLNDQKLYIAAAINESFSRIKHCIERHSSSIHKTLSAIYEAVSKSFSLAENIFNADKACANEDIQSKELCLNNTATVAQDKISVSIKELHYLMDDIQERGVTLPKKIDICSATSLREAGLSLNFIIEEIGSCIQKDN